MDTLQKFYANITEKSVHELFLRYEDEEYQISYYGRYVLVETIETGEAEEFCFGQNESELVEALLDARVFKNRTMTLREVLSKIPPDELILT